MLLDPQRNWINANGRWPLSVSGIPTTLASPTSGWDKIACSIAPARLNESIAFGKMTVQILTRTETVSSYINNIV